MSFDISELMYDLRKLNFIELNEKYSASIPQDYQICDAICELMRKPEGLSIAIDQAFDVRLNPSIEGIFLFATPGGYEVFALERGGKGTPFQFSDLESAVRCKIDWVLNNHFGVRSLDSFLFSKNANQ